MKWIIKNKKWLFSGIGVTILMLIFKTCFIGNEPTKIGVQITSDKVEANNIAGRDIIINHYSQDGDTISNIAYVKNEFSEYIKILEFRAKKINDSLDKYYMYTDVNVYLEKFNKLHNKHIQALKKGEIILAHEILTSIYNLSYDLQNSEFWTSHNIERPDVSYSLRDDEFIRGYLICEYIVGDMNVCSSKYPIFFSKFEERYVSYNYMDYYYCGKELGELNEDISKIYSLILETK